MAKRKYPSELNTRTVRVNIGDWQWLNSLSQSLGVTVAEAFHKVVTGQDHKAEPQRQIPLLDFRIVAPVAKGYRLQPTIATNGSKIAAFRIKTKGVKRYD